MICSSKTLEKLSWALLTIVTASLKVWFTYQIMHYAFFIGTEIFVFDRPLFIHLYLAVAVGLNAPFQLLSMSQDDAATSFFAQPQQPLLIAIGFLETTKVLGRVALLFIAPSLYTAIVLLGVPVTHGMRYAFFEQQGQNGWGQLGALLLIVFGLVIIVGPTAEVPPGGMVGLAFAFVCMLFGALEDVLIEVAIKRYGIPKGYAQGAAGVYGVPMALAVVGAGHGLGWEDAAHTYYLLQHAPAVLVGLFCAHFAVEFTFNLSAASVTKHLDATWKNILRGLRIPALLAVELCVPQLGLAAGPSATASSLGVLVIAVGVPLYAAQGGPAKALLTEKPHVTNAALSYSTFGDDSRATTARSA